MFSAFFKQTNPYVRYQVYPVAIAGVAAVLFLFFLRHPASLVGNLLALGIWCCIYAYFKLSAPARFRNDRVIWRTILTGIISLFIVSPLVFGLTFTTPVGFTIFWIPAPLLLLLEYLWPFPPEKQTGHSLPKAEEEKEKAAEVSDTTAADS